MRYFIATYYQKPKNRDGTPGKHAESVKTDTRVRPNDLRSAGVILDYRDRKVVKCHFQSETGEGRDFNTISEFYKGHYNNLISQIEAKYELLNALPEVLAEVQAEIAEDAVAEEVVSNKTDEAAE